MKSKLSGIIIDDEPDIVETLSMFLELKGIDIVGKGYNGCEAVTLYEKYNPDFVILDMNMPRYDGAHAIKEIRKKIPDAKILVVTGDMESHNMTKDVDAIFSKPCDLNKLLDSIKMVS